MVEEKNDSSSDSSDEDDTHIELGQPDLTFQVGGKRAKLDDDADKESGRNFEFFVCIIEHKKWLLIKNADNDKEKEPDTQKLIDISGKCKLIEPNP